MPTPYRSLSKRHFYFRTIANYLLLFARFLSCPKRFSRTGPVIKRSTSFTTDLIRSPRRGESPAKEGLSYIHSALGELCELSNMISRQSPVQPKPIIIRESEGGRIEME